MAYYYLVASLPLLELDGAIPFTPEEFLAANEAMLAPSDRGDVARAVAGETEACAHPFFRRYLERDAQLRNAMVRVRAAERRLEPGPFLREHEGFDAEAEAVAQQAASAPDPLQAELALDRYRWRTLEDLTRSDPFGAPQIFAFVMKLRIARRWSDLVEEQGRDRLERLIRSNLEKGNA